MGSISKSITNLNDAVEAIERKIGVNESTDPGSIEYRLNHIEFGGYYQHTQTTPSAIWNIQHNLGFKPGGIYCEDSAGTMLAPSVEHIDENIMILTFVGATDGFALFS